MVVLPGAVRIEYRIDQMVHRMITATGRTFGKIELGRGLQDAPFNGFDIIVDRTDAHFVGAATGQTPILIHIQIEKAGNATVVFQ